MWHVYTFIATFMQCAGLGLALIVSCVSPFYIAHRNDWTLVPDAMSFIVSSLALFMLGSALLLVYKIAQRS